MSAGLVLGATGTGRDPLQLDLDRLVGSHACIVANSGGGKSGLIRRLLEVTHGKIQHVVLDIEDEFYTLRERYDYVIAGGDGGDAPAAVESAEGLALAALTHGFSLIAQLNDLGPSAPEFVGRFLHALIGAPRELWRPVLVVLDEAQRFAPQDGNTAATSGVKALTAQGRKRGFTAVLASQRIAKIDADVRGDVNNWLLGRVGQSLDRRTLADALGFSPSSAEARGLQGLPDRTFWGFGPALSREPTLFRVADVETTPVRPGQAKIPTPPPPEALRSILEGIAAATAEQSEAKAIEAYQAGSELGQLLIEKDARIAELEQRGVSQRVRNVAYVKGLRIIRTAVQQAEALIAEALGQSTTLADTHSAGDEQEGSSLTCPSSCAGGQGEVAVDGNATASPETSLGAERKPLSYLAGVAPAGMTEADWAGLSGYKRKGGTWGTYKSRLRTAGFIEVRDGLWHATAAGIAAIGAAAVKLPPPGPERARLWAERIPGVGRMLDVLIKRWPHWTTKEALAADLGMAAGGGTFGTYLSRIRGNQLLEEKGKRLRLSTNVMGEP